MNDLETYWLCDRSRQ